MKRTTVLRTSGLALAALTLSAGLAACGGGDEPADATGSDTSSETPEEETPMEEESDAGEMDPAANLYGPACADVPTSGDGSVEGMATAPVASAASANPLLTTLVAAVTAADLVDPLNSAEELTVFAPANAAFEPIPKKDLDGAPEGQGDADPGAHPPRGPARRSPRPALGEFETLNGDMLTINGSGRGGHHRRREGHRALRRHPDRQRDGLRHRHRHDALIFPSDIETQGLSLWTTCAPCLPAPPRRGGVGGPRPLRAVEAVLPRRRRLPSPQFYDDTSTRAFGLAVRVVRDRAQAEEVTQEAFLEVWRSASRYDAAKGSAIGWLLTIVHRKAVDRVRSAEAASRRDTSYHQDNQSVAHDATAEAAEATMEARRVRGAWGAHERAA